jgi:VWFA-related protein
MNSRIALIFLLPMLGVQGQPTFRSDVTLIHVDTEVANRDGSIVDGLTKSDFRVFDDGKAQEIVQFGHEEEPLDLILLFDTSFSMRPVVERIAEEGRKTLSLLRKEDRVAVLAFDAGTDLITDFTSDLSTVERVIRDRVMPRSFPKNSQIQAAVDQAALHFQRRAPHTDGRRRAVIIVTDNLGMHREPHAVKDLWEADAVLSGLIVRDPGMAVQYGIYFPPTLAGVGGMSGIAEKTGGSIIRSGDASEGLRQMIRRLRLRYSLYFTKPAAKPGSDHKIRVELSADAAGRNPGAKVRARARYREPD